MSLVGVSRSLALAILCSVPALSASPSADRVIIGRVEYVLMQDVGMRLKARIDTGAGISSIHANVVRTEKTEDGKGERAVFELTDDTGRTKRIRRPITAWVEIKRKGATGTVRRPVVTMDICLAGRKLEGRFNLSDRAGFLYPVLVGRNILKTGDYLIDPKEKFMQRAECG